MKGKKWKNPAMVRIVFCALLTGNTAAAAPMGTTPESVSYQPYPYIFIVQQGDTISLTDEEFYDKAGKITFPVNRYNLPENDELITELATKVIPQLNRDSLQLLRIIVRGAASPDGPFENNQQLGKNRVQSLLDFLDSQMEMPVSEDVLSTQVDIEDYRSLCLMMRKRYDSSYQLVQQLCDTYLPIGRYDLLKEQLQRAKGGALWHRLLRDYFPELRAVRLILLFRKMPPPLPDPEPVPPMPEPIEFEHQPLVVPEAVVPEPIVVPEPVPDPIDSVLPRRELLSVKTNLLFYGVYMPGYNRWCPIPNVAIEYYPKNGHFTYGASFDCPWWTDYSAHKFFEVRNYQLETRYYLKNKPYKAYGANRANGAYEPYEPGPAYSGWFLQAYAHVGLFEIGFDRDRGWVGEGIGAGIGIGYVMPLSKKGHWRLEFALQAGWFGCKYDPFQYQNPVNPNYVDDLYYYKWTQSPSLFRERQYRYNWFGPTRIGITLSYDLLYRKERRIAL